MNLIMARTSFFGRLLKHKISLTTILLMIILALIWAWNYTPQINSWSVLYGANKKPSPVLSPNRALGQSFKLTGDFIDHVTIWFATYTEIGRGDVRVYLLNGAGAPVNRTDLERRTLVAKEIKERSIIDSAAMQLDFDPLYNLAAGASLYVLIARSDSPTRSPLSLWTDSYPAFKGPRAELIAMGADQNFKSTKLANHLRISYGFKTKRNLWLVVTNSLWGRVLISLLLIGLVCLIACLTLGGDNRLKQARVLPEDRVRLGVIYLIFFMTGFAALVYQVVWERLIGLSIGSDVISVSLVVSAYLLGLAVGSIVGGVWGDRLSPRRAVRAFALINAGTALFALLSSYFYYDFLFLRFSHLADGRWSSFIVAFLSLLVPTFLMGLSLPLLAKACVKQVQSAAYKISLLYCVNTIGAGVGAVVAALVIIGWFGYRYSTMVGAAISLIAAAAGLIVSTGFGSQGSDAVEPRADGDHLIGSGKLILWSLLVFCAGFIVISLEIVWFRIFSIITHAKSFTFGYILGVFLVLDAAGALVGAKLLPRIKQAGPAFLKLQLVIIGLSCGLIMLLSREASTQWLSSLMHLSQELDLDVFTLGPLTALSMVIIGVPAFLMGVSFPLSQYAVQDDVGTAARRTGILATANITGNTAGGLITGLILLSLIGVSGTICFLAAAGLLFCLVLLLPSGRRTMDRVWAGAAAVVFVALILSSGDNNRFWKRLHLIPDKSTAHIAEDASGVAAVWESDRGVHITNNGVGQGILPWGPLFLFNGSLGPLLHPDPKNVLVIGFASGGTTWAAAAVEKTEMVDAVEICGAQYTAWRQYAQDGSWPAMARIFDSDKIRLHVDDGRRFLKRSEKKYEVIQSSTNINFLSHSGLLYSEEFYRLCLDSLTENGIMVHFAPTSRVVRTFRNVFPHVILCSKALIGSRHKIDWDTDKLAAAYRDNELIRSFKLGTEARIVAHLPDLVAHPTIQFSGPPRRNDLNTDLFPRDEYYWIKSLF